MTEPRPRHVLEGIIASNGLEWPETAERARAELAALDAASPTEPRPAVEGNDPLERVASAISMADPDDRPLLGHNMAELYRSLARAAIAAYENPDARAIILSPAPSPSPAEDVGEVVGRLRKYAGPGYLRSLGNKAWITRCADDIETLIAHDSALQAEVEGLRGAAKNCAPMHPDEDGWSEWIHPLPGYRMQCCDCGLIHDMQFAITPREHETPMNPGESKDAVVVFRAKRAALQKDSPE